MSAVDSLLDLAHAEQPRGDPDTAVEFLRRLDPDGWHNLVAFHPDVGPDDARTFAPGQWEAMQRWIAARISKRDIYFSVNEPKPSAPHDRLRKEHIARIRAVYADIDPRDEALREPGGLEAERMRIAAQVEELERHFNDAPTFVIDSGGGMQPFWQLDQKLDAGEHGRWAEGVGRAIYKQLDGDAVQNIDRVMRLPGTINHAGGKKRALGRRPAPAILRYADGGRHRPEWLEQWAPPVAAPDKIEDDPASFAVDMTAVRAATIWEDLPTELRAKFDALRNAEPSVAGLWGGNRSARPGKDDSGSGFGFALADCLRRTGKFTPTEFGQLLWVWGRWSPDKIDERQIRRAWAKADPPPPPPEVEFEPVEIAAPADDEFDFPPVEPFDFGSIPPREWVVDRLLVKRFVTGIIAPPGTGKTAFSIAVALAVATGRSDIVPFKVRKRERVLLWNQEDDSEELKRRLAAAMLHFGVTWDDLRDENGEPMLYMESGVDNPALESLKGKQFLIAREHDEAKIIATKEAKKLGRFIARKKIGVVSLDPMLELHNSNENDNQKMRAVTAIFRDELAVKNNCALLLYHHTRKPPKADAASFAGDMDAGRGATAIAGVCRLMATLFTLDEATAKHFRITEGDRTDYVRFDDAKSNLSRRSGEPTFLRHSSVLLDGIGSEEVGVLCPAKLEPATTAAETKTREREELVSMVLGILAEEPNEWVPVGDLARRVAEAGTFVGATERNIRDRMHEAFASPVNCKNGEIIRKETRRISGKPGRPAALILEMERCDGTGEKGSVPTQKNKSGQ